MPQDSYTNRPRNPIWYRNPWTWLTSTGPGIFTLLISSQLAIAAAPFVYRNATDPWYVTAIQSLIPLLATAIILYGSHGKPSNWLVVYFGHEMTANEEKLISREQAGESSENLFREIAAHVEQSSTGLFIKVHPYRYKFLRKKDAMMFKLVWG